MTNMKAEKGDLIRVIKKAPQVTAFEVGGIYEVTGESYDGQVDIAGIDGFEAYVDHDEYVIHRKAGEEDSESPVEPSKWSDTQPNLIRLAGEELTELLVRKNHDYGDSFSQQYAKYGALSAMIRMDDKMRRLETLLGGEQAQVDESLADTLLDLAGYALLAYVETRKK